MEPKSHQIDPNINKIQSKTKQNLIQNEIKFLRVVISLDLFFVFLVSAVRKRMRALAPSSEKMRASARILASKTKINK